MKRCGIEEHDAVSVKRLKQILEHVDSICCPITLQVMRDPVVLQGDGRTYEREDIEAWIAKKATSPYTGLELDDDFGRTLTPNVVLRTTIESILREAAVAEEKALQNHVYEEGMLVEIHSLLNATDLNGKHGECGIYNDGRYVVRILSDDRQIKVKHANLRQAQTTEARRNDAYCC
uniref:U-box domain-containing protein n=1 Tax=Aureoumbra lagunensis TaxID=44058 RepID=A0A7S3NLR6_9STRA